MYWYYKYPLFLLIAVLTGTAVWWGAHIYGSYSQDFGTASCPSTRQAECKTAKPKMMAATASAPEVKTAASTPPVPPSSTRVPMVTGTAAVVATSSVVALLPPPPPSGPAISSAPPTPTEFEKRMKLAGDTLAKGNWVMARGIAENALRLPEVKPLDAQWFQAADIIGKANFTLATTTAPAPEKVRYQVKGGDTLIGIRNKYQTTLEILVKSNKLDATNPVIREGMVLSIYPAKWSVEVSKNHFLLVIRNDGKLFKYYRIGTGRENRTPVGTFKINNRMRNPEWSPPGRQPVPFGNPENVLGTRWLGLLPIEGTDSTLKGFGIHGTWQPDTIGTAASEGCVRMKNDDVDELFDLIPPGTRVTIKDE